MNTYLDVLDALGDPTRRKVFELLRDGDLAVGELARHLPVSRPAVSQHLKVLEEAGLVVHTRTGTRHLYAISPEGVGQLREWLDGFWELALDRFKHVAEQKGTET